MESKLTWGSCRSVTGENLYYHSARIARKVLAHMATEAGDCLYGSGVGSVKCDFLRHLRQLHAALQHFKENEGHVE